MNRSIRRLFVLAFSFGLAPGRAGAAEVPSLDAANVFGRTGLVFTDSARTLGRDRTRLSGHAVVGLDGDFKRALVPLAGSHGLSDELELNAGLHFLFLDLDTGGLPVDGTRAGFDRLSLGAKYRLPGGDPALPELAVGGEVFHGPFLDDLGNSSTGAAFRGIASRQLSGGVFLTGELGLVLEGDRGPDNALQAAAGAATRLSPTLTGMAELALNRFADGDGLLSVGVRADGAPAFQAFLGFGLGDGAPDVLLGGGLSF